MSEITEKKRKKFPIKKLIIFIIALIAVGAIAFGVFVLFKEEEKEALTSKTTYGALDRSIEGSGTTVPAEQLSVTAVSSAEIKTVNVSVGDIIEVGDLLYTQDDSEVDEKISDLRDQITEKQEEISDYETNIDDRETSISDTYEKIAEYKTQIEEIKAEMELLSIKAEFDGRIENVKVEVGDKINNGTALATLTDINTMEIRQYYSYAYFSEVTIGMSAKIKLQNETYYIDGKVTDIKAIEWITSEGMKCFEVTVTFENPGAVTLSSVAECILITGGGIQIYPSSDATLSFKNTEVITSEVTGEITAVNVQNYLAVKTGELLFTVNSEAYTTEIENIEKQITSAEKQITSDKKQITNIKKKIENANEKIVELLEQIDEVEESREDYSMRSEIAGKVMYVNIEPGDTPSSMMSAVTIYNLETMNISVNFDELDVDNISEGTEVTITRTSSNSYQNYTGVITYLSPEASSSNGVATFAATIEIASNGELSAGVSVSYKISLGDSEEGVLAPISALKSNDGKYYLYVKSDTAPENAVTLENPETEIPTGFYAVPVEVGNSNSQYIRIISGVDKDTEVFTRYRQTAPTGGSTTSESGEEGFDFGSMPGFGGMPDFGGEMPDFGGNMPNMGGNMGGSSQRPSGNSGGMPSGMGGNRGGN